MQAAGVESSCIDGIPIIDQLPGTDNTIVGTGWSGHGFAISLAVNKLLRDWICDGKKPALLRPFAYERSFPESDEWGVWSLEEGIA